MKRSSSKTDSVPLEVIQNLEFGILKYIRDVCDQNGLRYYLAYGTLIGAVRHQGFIPWDDDVDIHMPRPDYMKFVEIVKKNPHPYYKLISGETAPKFTQILAKVIDTRTKLTQISAWPDGVQLGVYVDIFILDGAGDTMEEAETVYREAYWLFDEWRKSVRKAFYPKVSDPDISRFRSFARWIKYTPERRKGFNYWRNRHDTFSKQYTYDDSHYVAAMAAGTEPPSRNIWVREWFGDGTELLFCGESFRVPADWDSVLKPEYGDYMMLPPEEKRHPKHHYTLVVPPELMTKAGER